MPVFSRALFVILLLTATVSPLRAAQEVVDKVVAQINGEVITLFELNDRVRMYRTQVDKKPYNPSDPAIKDLQQRILKTLVDDILISQEAARLKVKVSDAEIESRIREMREKGRLTEEQFNQQLRLEGMTRKQFSDALKKDIVKKQILGYMVQRKVVVPDEEVRAYYDANKGSIKAEVGQRIGLIMLNKMDEAKALKQRIAGGQISFADAARKFSVGPGAEQGGDLGKVELRDLAPELQQALANVQPGQVSDPVMLDGKPVLLTFEASSGPEAPASGSAPAYESVKDDIRERIFREKLDKQFSDYLDKLRAKAVIKINL